MSFEFGKNLMRMEINGKIFHAVLTDSLKSEILGAKKEIDENKGKWDLSDKESEKKLICRFDTFIDGILGSGSASKIFDGRFPDAFERITVFIYICTEINGYIDKIKNHEK